jgi:rhamnosyltransferase
MTSTKSRVSLIIPTLNAGAAITLLIQALENQTRQLDEIFVIDSSSTDSTQNRVRALQRQYTNLELKVIPKNTFNHGGTRDLAFRLTDGEYVLFMTQDALPSSNTYVNEILKPFIDPSVAMVSGRQIPRENASLFEKYVREFNYPEKPFIRRKDDITRLGVKAYFASDVCSAYRRSSYLSVGGFDSPIETNEDMLIAAKFLNAGKAIAYQPQASVIHSHNLSLRQQYVRNKQIAKIMERYHSRLGGIDATPEGKRMVLAVSRRLLSDGHIISFIHFGFDCLARYCGNRVGKVAEHRHKR